MSPRNNITVSCEYRTHRHFAFGKSDTGIFKCHPEDIGLLLDTDTVFFISVSYSPGKGAGRHSWS
jgi:hypothetical protein